MIIIVNNLDNYEFKTNRKYFVKITRNSTQFFKIVKNLENYQKKKNEKLSTLYKTYIESTHALNPITIDNDERARCSYSEKLKCSVLVFPRCSRTYRALTSNPFHMYSRDHYE
jgi:hypothetical protein